LSKENINKILSGDIQVDKKSLTSVDNARSSINLDSKVTSLSENFLRSTNSVIGREFDLSTDSGFRARHLTDALSVSVDTATFNALSGATSENFLRGTNRVIDRNYYSNPGTEILFIDHPKFDDESLNAVKKIFKEFKSYVSDGSISHFTSYAEIDDKTININCVQVIINISGNIYGSHHIGNNYSIKLVQND
jgi:hypothetical protein